MKYYYHFIYIACEKMHQFMTHMYRNRGNTRYAISLKAESQVHLYGCIHAWSKPYLTDGQVEGSAREFRIEIEFFAPGTALNERECAQPPRSNSALVSRQGAASPSPRYTDIV